MTTPTTLRRMLTASALMLAVGLAGCQISTNRASVNPVATSTGQQPRAYPFGSEPVAVHDIQVFREITRLRLTNTTANSYPACTVWVNRRYALDINGFASGDSLNLDLTTFVDEFGTPFKAGGFFATRKPDPVVLVEFEIRTEPPQVHGLVLVRDEVQ